MCGEKRKYIYILYIYIDLLLTGLEIRATKMVALIVKADPSISNTKLNACEVIYYFSLMMRSSGSSDNCFDIIANFFSAI